MAAINKQNKKQIEDIKNEKDKMMEDMIKMQSENDLNKERIQTMEKNKKIHKNLHIFNAIVENGHDIPPVLIKEPDECIHNEICTGNCEKVKDLKRLNTLKRSGSIRTCPQRNPDDKPFFKCGKCDFMTQNEEYFNEHMEKHRKYTDDECPQCGYKTKKKSDFEKHMKNVHGNFPSCTICHVGLWSKEAVKKHVSKYHSAESANTTDTSTPEQSTSINQQSENNKRPCHYFSTQNGCKKGDRCNFDHSADAQAKNVTKVPKLCKDKEACVWKPQCRYVHPEDGEALPERRVRGGHIERMVSQDFGPQHLSQQPPGWSQFPPPTPPSPSPAPAQPRPQEEQERKTNVIQEFLKLIVPDLMCMNQFPNLRKRQM